MGTGQYYVLSDVSMVHKKRMNDSINKLKSNFVTSAIRYAINLFKKKQTLNRSNVISVKKVLFLLLGSL